MRNLTTFILFLLAFTANARQISPDEAAAIASDFLNSSSLQIANARRIDVKRARAKSDTDGKFTSPYYVFNGEGNQGFVIISGDDRAKKILGYSDTGNFDFDNLPPQLAAMLDQYAEQIASLPESAAADPSWSAPPRDASTEEGKLLETANWGQGYPYNAQCPEMDGQRCVTGCVATAMAIVMKYHNWPDRSVGSNVYWDRSKSDYEETDYSKVEYDWSSMTNMYDEQSSQESIHAVATLMNAAGHTVEMSYSPWESGALACYIGHALRTHFKYAESCEFIHKSRYTNDEWTEMLRDELNAGRPVIYQGSGIGNHAFVCDGYSNEGLFHFNWGWDGSSNGYFSLSALDPMGYDFSKDYAMVRGIEPDRSGSEYSDAYVDAGYSSEYLNNTTGAKMNVENIIKNEPFFFACRTLTMPAGFSGEYGVAVVDKNGNVKSVLASTQHIGRRDIREKCAIEYENIVSSEIEPESTDMIQVVTKRVDEGRWLPVRGTSEAPSKLHAKGHDVEITDIELITNEERACFSYLGQELQPGHYKLAAGGRFLSWFGMSSEEFKEGYYYCCIVNYNGQSEVVSLNYQNSGIDRVLRKGKYIISLVAREAAKETVTLNTAGTLANLIDIEKACAVSELTIEGFVNFKDLEYIRTAFVNLRRLDMTKSTIVSSQAERKNYMGNALPEYSLSGLKSLEYIFLPEDLESIGDYALASCNLDAIELPASIRQIGSAAFYENPELNAVMVHWTEPITVPSDAFYYTACPDNGTLYVPLGTRDKYSSADIWSQFNRIEEKEIFDIVAIDYIADGIKYKLMPSDHTASIVGFTASIPEDVIVQESIIYKDVAYTVSSIKTEAFYDCENLHTFKMPNTIKEIGEDAFMSCDNLRTVTISNTLEYIPTGCFCYCYALESAEIPKSVKFIGGGAFDTAKSLKNIHIPANTELHPNGAFDGLSSCVSITVDENSPYYVAEDNMLFSKDRKDLILLAGTKEGKIVIPESVERLPWRLFYFMPYITDIQLPSTYTGDIPYQFVSDCPMLKHVAFPDASKKTNTETVTRCETLESLTIGRNLEYGSGIKENPLLKHVFLRNNYRLDLLQVFNDGLYKNMNFYTDRTEPNAILDECEAFYVPGGCKKRFEGIAKCIISEMWQYGIDRNSNMLAIIPAEDYIVIDKVTINGKVVESVNGCFYKFENLDNLDVIVDFTLMGRQSMTTHYDVDFTASLPNTDLTKVQKITMDKSDSELYVGQSLQLSAVVTPESAINKAVEWSSNNHEVLTVDQYGKVTAHAPGEATITATATDGSGVSASCHVTVSPVLVESLTLSPDSWSGIEGDTFQITATVMPENATDKTLVWDTRDAAVATVDSAGVVSVLKAGSCVITASTVDGSNLTAECIITGPTGIDSMFADGVKVDVYNANGVLLKRGCGKTELKSLAPGVYIVRDKNKAKTIIIY